jgi:hypothetical protein
MQGGLVCAASTHRFMLVEGAVLVRGGNSVSVEAHTLALLFFSQSEVPFGIYTLSFSPFDISICLLFNVS